MDANASIAMLPGNRRTRNVINRLLQTRQISPAGVQWLFAATDPFHDTPVSPDGFPDILSSRTVVQCVQLTTSVSSPFDNDDLWDAHIFFAPLTPSYTQVNGLKKADDQEKKLEKEDSRKKVRFQEREKVRVSKSKARSERRNKMLPKSVFDTNYLLSTISSGGVVNQNTPYLEVAPGINIMTVGAGDSWVDTDSGANISTCAIPAQYASGSWRLIAVGYEVHNTTPELYLGGSITAYRSPGAPTMGNLYLSTTDTSDNTYYQNTAAKFVVIPPTTQADAALFPNSRTWEAKAGIYQPVTFSSLENPFITPMPGCAGFISPSDYTDLANGVGWEAFLPAIASPDPVGLGGSLTTTLPFDVCGCVIAGQQGQATLQVTVKYYFERAPSIADPDLLVLAKNPPPYDPLAFEIYSRALDELPVAVPVGENPLGEWFADILDAVAKYAPIVGSALGVAGVPFAGAVGTALAAGAKGVQKVMVPDGHWGDTVVIQQQKKKRKNRRKKGKTTTVTRVTQTRGRSRKPRSQRRRTRSRALSVKNLVKDAWASGNKNFSSSALKEILK